MNFMAREMHPQADLLRTKVRQDESGLLFVESVEPKMLLTFMADSHDLQNEIEVGIRGVFALLQDREVNLLLAGREDEELIWAVTPAYAQALQVA